MNKAAVIAGIVVVLAAIAGIVVLQGDLFAQDGPWGGGRPGGRPDMGRMPRGGGGSAMTALGNSLFVLSGTTLYKINPGTMQVEKTLEIKPPEGPGGPGGEGPGGGGPGGGGGGR